MNAQIGNPDAPAVSPGNYTTIINNGVIAPGLGRFNNTFDNTVSQFVPLTLAGNYKAEMARQWKFIPNFWTTCPDTAR